jgi:hypothetical protein
MNGKREKQEPVLHKKWLVMIVGYYSTIQKQKAKVCGGKISKPSRRKNA